MSGRAHHGSIEVPKVGSIPALVELDAARATAVLLVHPLTRLDDFVGTRVGIDLTTDRGLLHVEADVAEFRDGEVLELDVTGDREVVQRREYARVDAVLEVTVAPRGGAHRRAAIAVNISGSGLVVSRLDEVAAGEQVDLWLELTPAEPPIKISGRVVRELGENLRAVHFENVHKADRERIVHFVFQRQRLELQRMKRA
jgi:hypothetical protein